MTEPQPDLSVVFPRLRLSNITRWGAVALALGILALFFLRPPWNVVGKTYLVGYAVCHQLPSHSFHLGGRQLPLCARCTGIYLGAFYTLSGLFLVRRGRPGQMPPVSILTVLLGFIALMAFDGTNSYLASFFPSLPHLYEPQNWLRLTTGLLAGMSLAIIVTPLFHVTVWQVPSDKPVLPDWRSFWPFLLSALALIPLVSAEIPLLFYPIAVTSTAGVVLLLSTTNTVLATIFLRMENRAKNWREVSIPLVTGVGLAFLEIMMMDTVRAAITAALGLPF